MAGATKGSQGNLRGTWEVNEKKRVHGRLAWMQDARQDADGGRECGPVSVQGGKEEIDRVIHLT